MIITLTKHENMQTVQQKQKAPEINFRTLPIKNKTSDQKSYRHNYQSIFVPEENV